MILTRIDRAKDGIFGELTYPVQGIHFLTLEHAYPLGDGSVFAAKIPEGSYSCVRGMHILPGMKKPFETFEITGVKNHTNLLFHMGNYNGDSEGCILLGFQIARCQAGRMITESDQCFLDFMKAMQGINEFTLIIEDQYA